MSPVDLGQARTLCDHAAEDEHETALREAAASTPGLAGDFEAGADALAMLPALVDELETYRTFREQIREALADDATPIYAAAAARTALRALDDWFDTSPEVNEVNALHADGDHEAAAEADR